jgi:hypothetical protein
MGKRGKTRLNGEPEGNEEKKTPLLVADRTNASSTEGFLLSNE